MKKNVKIAPSATQELPIHFKTAKVCSQITGYFQYECRAFKPSTDSDVDIIKLPLTGYHGDSIQLFVECRGAKFAINDGGWVVSYLADKGIMTWQLVKKGHYSYYYEEVRRRHHVRLSQDHSCFEIVLNRPDGEKLFAFAQGLVRLTYLAMTKGIGMKPVAET